MSIQQCRDIATTRNGKCLSSNFVTHRHKLRWYCNETQQEFTASLQEVINGKWCDKKEAEAEEEAEEMESFMKEEDKNDKIKEVLYKLTGKEFSSSKPRWLYGLELDGYNEELELGYIIKTVNCYKALLGSDDVSPYIEYMTIKELAINNDKVIIEIPYWVKNFEDYIIDKLES